MSTLKVNNITDLGNDYPGSLAYPGQILQVVSTNKTDTFSVSSSSFVDVTGLNVSITPRSTSSKILVMAEVNRSVAAGTVLLNLVRNSTTIAQPSAGAAPATVQSVMDSSNQGIVFLDSPSTTSSVTYKIQMANTAGTAYINRQQSNSAYTGISTITVMEVAG